MTEIVNIYRKKTSNTGDRFSTPTKYFDFLKDVETLDFTELSLEDFGDYINNKIVIFGGGGFIEQDYFKEYMDVLLNSNPKLLIGWGVGHNVHGSCDINFDSYDYSKKFDLLGLRDSTHLFNWVPCSSCMHSVFDKQYEIRNKIVIYEHKNFPIKNLELNFPKMKNGDSFEEIIEFLGSSELIITNSYHGAYWATLLGRRVLIIQPFSSKFFGFKHPLVVSSNFDIDNIKNIPVYPNALKEARKANVMFSENIIKIIKNI